MRSLLTSLSRTERGVTVVQWERGVIVVEGERGVIVVAGERGVIVVGGRSVYSGKKTFSFLPDLYIHTEKFRIFVTQKIFVLRVINWGSFMAIQIICIKMCLPFSH